MWPLHWSQSMF